MWLKTVNNQRWSRPWVRLCTCENFTKEGTKYLTWKDYKADAIADYLAGMSVKDIADKYNNSIPNIIGGLQRANVYKYVNIKWTDEEMDILREYYPNLSWGQLLPKLPRFTKAQITQKASSLKIKRQISFWSKADVDTLVNAYEQGLSVRHIADLLGNRYSTEAIYTKAHKMNLHQREWWTDEEESFLRQNYETMETEELMEHFPNRKLVTVQNHARSMGLHSYTYLSRKWEEVDDKFILDNWQSMTDPDMASVLCRTHRSVKWRREKLGCFREIPPGTYEYLRKYLWKENKRWRIESIKACGYKCIVTGQRFTDVHHLYGSNLIVQETLEALGLQYHKVSEYTEEDLERIAQKYAEINLTYPLGVCLCQDIHMHFHSEYGYGNNTPKQFQEFLESHYPHVQIPVTIMAA